MKKAFILTFFAIGLTVIGTLSVAAQAEPAKSTAVAGEWEGSVNTPGGPRPLKLVFKVDGEKLTGTVKRNDGELPLEGTIKGKDITFSYTINYNGNDLMLSYAGTVSADAMSGSVSFGGNGDDTWSAKRVVPVKPKTE